MKSPKIEIALFFAIMTSLSFVVFLFIIEQASFLEGSKALGLLLMWITGIAAFSALRALQLEFRFDWMEAWEAVISLGWL